MNAGWLLIRKLKWFFVLLAVPLAIFVLPRQRSHGQGGCLPDEVCITPTPTTNIDQDPNAYLNVSYRVWAWRSFQLPLSSFSPCVVSENSQMRVVFTLITAKNSLVYDPAPISVPLTFSLQKTPMTTVKAGTIAIALWILDPQRTGKFDFSVSNTIFVDDCEVFNLYEVRSGHVTVQNSREIGSDGQIGEEIDPNTPNWFAVYCWLPIVAPVIVFLLTAVSAYLGKNIDWAKSVASRSIVQKRMVRSHRSSKRKSKRH